MKRFSIFLLSAASLFGAGELSHRRAPGFSIVDSVQQQHDLADYRGKYLIIDLMQTICVHCMKFSEIIEKISIKYRGKVHAVSIVVPPDNLTKVTEYIKQHNVTIPILFDCGQVYASYLKLSPANPHVTFPHAFLVDPDGMIVNDWAYGAGSDDIFEGDGMSKELDRVLAGKK